MFLAVGVGAYSAAIFHMITHAFFKALLFLGAGSVIHGMHDEQDMRRMGGLRKFMPITAGTFIVGWLAIAGIIPFAGFWSKDEILAKAWFSHNYALWAVGAVAALLTAFYMTRQVWLVFYGPERWRDDADARRRGDRRRARRRRRHAGTTHGTSRTSRRGRCTSRSSCSRCSRSSAASSTCRSPTRSSTSSIAGSSCPRVRSSRRRRSAPRSCSRRSRSTIGVVGIVVGIARVPQRAARRRHRPHRRAAGRLRRRARERVVPRHRSRPVRQRSGHRVRPLPQ